ncbi:SIS domain-containing protein [Jinshanibacter sp. LJY008]|uniref:SIS domain-containing protein n=1 Tax=Limnobaculum eriocheiris TaxID=2897391 RepID=A0A9X1MV57_9GAMM|nr:SIS domain-containing protein [Limnobaculum eriocheiris]MCD1125327.1 SIS domain-containing protein [Limnobaculum eriocheiris]
MSHYLGYTAEELKHSQAILTAREITQQPSCWLKSHTAIGKSLDKIQTFLTPIFAKPDLRIIMTGAGTSAFIGHSIAPTLRQLTNKRIDSIATTDLVSNPDQYLNKNIPTLIVSFGRSGNSPESLATIALADQYVSDCYHLVLTCNIEGQLYQRSLRNHRALALLMPEETNDKSFAMTSSFTSMMLSALTIFSTGYPIKQDIERMYKCSETIITEFNSEINRIANQHIDRVIYLGSGGLRGLAQESALKLLELTAGQVIAGYESPLGFRHGPKSIVNSNTMIIVFISNNPYTRRYDLDLLQELRHNNIAARIIAITAQLDETVTKGEFWQVPGMESATDVDLLFPYILFAQLYAFHKSLMLSNTPDNPCPTGEVNRVVQGVTIYKFNN